MSRLFYHVMQDNAGNLLFDVSGTMRLAGSGTLATIYGDEALTVILPNPMTNHPSFGSFKCFLGAGDYDFYMAKSGYTFETLTGVQGHGTMAQQDASAVAITGGAVAGLTSLGIGGTPSAGQEFYCNGDALFAGPMGLGAIPTPGMALEVVGKNYFRDEVGIGRAAQSGNRLSIDYLRSGANGIIMRPTDNDTGPFATVTFLNVAAVEVGSIRTNATATSFNTTSDARLKHAITALTGALAVVQALRPVAFRWKSDDSPGRGFVADEVAAVVDGVISGDKDAVDEEGNIRPQMIDYSKLVPFLVGAVKTLSEQVEALTARLAAAGA